MRIGNWEFGILKIGKGKRVVCLLEFSSCGLLICLAFDLGLVLIEFMSDLFGMDGCIDV